jgi:hypothetical protein
VAEGKSVKISTNVASATFVFTTSQQKESSMELVLSTELSAYINEVDANLSAYTSIQSNEEVEAAALAIKQAKDLVKRINAARRAYTDQLDLEKKRLLNQEKALIQPIDAHLARIKTLTDNYLEERRRIAEEAKCKALEAATSAQESHERNQRAAEAFGIATTVDVPVNPEPTHTLTPTEIQSLEKLSGVSSRTTWSYKVIDLSLVPRQFLTVNDAYVKGFLKAEKALGKSASDVAIPGIEVFEKTTTVIR